MCKGRNCLPCKFGILTLAVVPYTLTLSHSEWPKLHSFVILSAIGLKQQLKSLHVKQHIQNKTSTKVFSGMTWGFFPLQNNIKNLDPSSKMDLDFWGYVAGKNLNIRVQSKRIN